MIFHLTKCCLKYISLELSLLYKLKFYVDMTNGERACDMSAPFLLVYMLVVYMKLKMCIFG